MKGARRIYMKKKILLFTIIAVVTVMVLGVLLTGCYYEDKTKSGIDQIKEGGKLVIATSANFPPFENLEKGKIVGWDIDVAQALADELGVELEIQNMDFEAVLSAVATGKVHIGMAGISNTPARDKNVDFSMNVFDSSQMIIVRADNTSINGPMDLAGKRVAVQAGTIGNFLADMNKDYAYDFDDDGNPILDSPILGAPGEVIKLESGTLALQRVKDGQADAVILDKLPAEEIVNNLNAQGGAQLKILSSSVYDDAYAFAVGEGNTELKEWIDATFKKLQDNGTISRLNEKWFGGSAE